MPISPPLWKYIQYNTNPGYVNYNALTVSGRKRMLHGLQFQSSYINARNLTNENGALGTSAGAFQNEFGVN